MRHQLSRIITGEQDTFITFYLLAAAGLAGLRIAGAVLTSCELTPSSPTGWQDRERVCCPAEREGGGLLRTPWQSLPALTNGVSGLLKDPPVIVLLP